MNLMELVSDLAIRIGNIVFVIALTVAICCGQIPRGTWAYRLVCIGGSLSVGGILLLVFT